MGEEVTQAEGPTRKRQGQIAQGECWPQVGPKLAPGGPLEGPKQADRQAGRQVGRQAGRQASRQARDTKVGLARPMNLQVVGSL